MRRRTFLSRSVMGGLALGFVNPGIAWASAGTDKRFVFVIQRGAADGLSILAPTGDADFLRARGDLAADSLKGTNLDGLFTLHPSLPGAADLFRQGQAGFVHAMASGSRDRSHFDAQNMLETGASRPYGSTTGWMNRLLTLLPAAEARALAIAPTVPLALRGPAPASTYAKSRLLRADDDLKRRIGMLYAGDQQLDTLWQDALATDSMAGVANGNAGDGAALGSMAAGLLAGPQGARVMMLETTGWDTHGGQSWRLAGCLKQLDGLVSALKQGLGPDWKDTLVFVATEFGRTVAFNGTAGTDHGTASAAMFFGGQPMSGGKVTADWPGLASGSLFEARDLKPTARFENVVSSALARHYTIDEALVRRTLFPEFA